MAAASSWADMIKAAAWQHTEEWAAVEAMTAPGTILHTLSACTAADALRAHGYVITDPSTFRDTESAPGRPTEIRTRELRYFVEDIYVFDGYTLTLQKDTSMINWTLTRPGHSGFGPPTIVREDRILFTSESGAPHNLFGPSIYTTDGEVDWCVRGGFYGTPERYAKAVAKILSENPDLARPPGSRTKAARA